MTWGDCFQKKISAQYVPRTGKATERAQTPNTIPRIPHMATAPVLTESAVGQSGLSTEQCTELDTPPDTLASPHKVPPLQPYEFMRILELRRQGLNAHQISRKLHRHHTTVMTALREMGDTTEVAKAVARAGALKLMQRVIDSADVDQAVDVLSRPGIAVLQPAEQASKGSGVQVMVGINLPGLPEGGQ